MHTTFQIVVLALLCASWPRALMAQPMHLPSHATTPATSLTDADGLALPTSASNTSTPPVSDASRRTNEQCNALSATTGKEHYYGEGVLTALVDAVPAAEGISNPFDPSAFKGYVAHFDSPDFSSERTYIRATNARFKNSVVELLTQHKYGFCYLLQGKRHTAIDHPETIHRIKE